MPGGRLLFQTQACLLPLVPRTVCTCAPALYQASNSGFILDNGFPALTTQVQLNTSSSLPIRRRPTYRKTHRRLLLPRTLATPWLYPGPRAGLGYGPPRWSRRPVRPAKARCPCLPYALSHCSPLLLTLRWEYIPIMGPPFSSG